MKVSLYSSILGVFTLSLNGIYIAYIPSHYTCVCLCSLLNYTIYNYVRRGTVCSYSSGSGVCIGMV